MVMRDFGLLRQTIRARVTVRVESLETVLDENFFARGSKKFTGVEIWIVRTRRISKHFSMLGAGVIRETTTEEPYGGIEKGSSPCAD